MAKPADTPAAIRHWARSSPNELYRDLSTGPDGLTTVDAARRLDERGFNILPEAKKTLEEMRRAIDSADRLLSSADNTLLGPDAPAQQELRDALKEIARSARALRALADALSSCAAGCPAGRSGKDGRQGQDS